MDYQSPTLCLKSKVLAESGHRWIFLYKAAHILFMVIIFLFMLTNVKFLKMINKVVVKSADPSVVKVIQTKVNLKKLAKMFHSPNLRYNNLNKNVTLNRIASLL